MRFAPGNRANPKGRPRVGESLANAIREKWTAPRIIALMEDIAASDDVKSKLGLLNFVATKGYQLYDNVPPPAEPELTDEELREEYMLIAREVAASLPVEERIRLLAGPAPTDTVQ